LSYQAKKLNGIDKRALAKYLKTQGVRKKIWPNEFFCGFQNPLRLQIELSVGQEKGGKEKPLEASMPATHEGLPTPVK
jgi:hypothetical protein